MNHAFATAKNFVAFATAWAADFKCDASDGYQIQNKLSEMLFIEANQQVTAFVDFGGHQRGKVRDHDPQRPSSYANVLTAYR